MKRQRTYVKPKVNTEKTLTQLENEAIEALERQMQDRILEDQKLQYIPAPSSTISTPANLQPVHFDSQQDIKDKINSLCVSIIDTKMNNRSNDAVRVRAADTLARVNGIGAEKDNQQLIVEVMMIFNQFLLLTDSKLASDLTKAQKDFMMLVVSSTNLNHLSFMVNNISSVKPIKKTKKK